MVLQFSTRIQTGAFMKKIKLLLPLVIFAAAVWGYSAPTISGADEPVKTEGEITENGMANADSPLATGTVSMNKNVYFAYRSFWPEFATMKRFFDSGVNTVCIFPASTTNSLGEPYGKYPLVWRYPDKYDWGSLDQQFDDIIAINPNVRFLCMVDLNTPVWLARMLGMNGDGNYDSFIDLSNCLASPRWKEMTLKYLQDFLNHTEARYGDRIDAYILACGQTDEWMDYSAGRTGRARMTAFKNWQKEQGMTPCDAVPYDAQDKAAFNNLIRDPQTESLPIAWTQFNQELVADTIIEFARKTKVLIAESGKPAKEVGVFFGYIMELTGWRMTGCGHLGYEKVFASPYLDFFISPGTYGDRPMGGGSGFMISNGTRLLDGKGFMHETDHRTTTYNCNLNEYVSIGWMNNWESQEEDIAGMRREMALALINHASVWFFDMWGGAHKTDAAIDNIAKMKSVWDRFESNRSGTAAEVLLVVDPQSVMMINDRGPDTPLINHGTRNCLNRLGAPFEIVSFNDLERMNLDRYKLLVFPSPYLITPEREKILTEKVCTAGRSVLWLYAPGICDGQTLDPGRVEKWTGVPFGTGELQITRHENWTSYYFADYKQLTVPILKQIAQDAGVTIYCDEEVPVYANGKLVAVHVKNGGIKKITLPKTVTRITEVYSGKVVAENANEFEYEFVSPETALFELE